MDEVGLLLRVPESTGREIIPAITHDTTFSGPQRPKSRYYRTIRRVISGLVRQRLW